MDKYKKAVKSEKTKSFTVSDINPLNSFEELLRFESLLNDSNDSIHIQEFFIYNIAERIFTDQLFPYYLSGEKYSQAIIKLKALLRKINPDLLIDNTVMDYYHKFFVMKLADIPITVLNNKKNLCIYHRDRLIHRRSQIEIVISKFTIRNRRLVIEAFLKDPVFLFIDEPTLFAVINGRNKRIPLFRSDAGRYRSKIMTNVFYGFEINMSIEDIRDIYFKVDICGMLYKVSYYHMWFSRLHPSEGKYSFEEEGYRLDVGLDNKFHISHSENTEKKNVWLYYDCRGVKRDNGLQQFLHDVKINDGIDRYYVLTDELQLENSFLPVEYKKNIVEFGSNKHKRLLKKCDKILASYIEHKSIYPFDYEEHQRLSDDITAEIIYLQHGVLHASMPWKYSPEIVYFDKIVVSSYFEVENYHKKYHVPKRKMIMTGMPRFEYLDRNKKPDIEIRRILFAPTWRSYLINEDGTGWQKDNPVFKASKYYKGLKKFLCSKNLFNFLKSENIVLDFKLHPVFSCYRDLFEPFSNKYINIKSSSVNEEDYSMFITDFSSMAFDYVWLKRPVIYYVPDMEEFRAGFNSYRELDLPFEKAFGKLTLKPADLLKEIKYISSKGYVLDSKYKSRMDSFFLPITNCSEYIYEELKAKG